MALLATLSLMTLLLVINSQRIGPRLDPQFQPRIRSLNHPTNSAFRSTNSNTRGQYTSLSPALKQSLARLTETLKARKNQLLQLQNQRKTQTLNLQPQSSNLILRKSNSLNAPFGQTIRSSPILTSSSQTRLTQPRKQGVSPQNQAQTVTSQNTGMGMGFGLGSMMGQGAGFGMGISMPTDTLCDGVNLKTIQMAMGECCAKPLCRTTAAHPPYYQIMGMSSRMCIKFSDVCCPFGLCVD